MKEEGVQQGMAEGRETDGGPNQSRCDSIQTQTSELRGIFFHCFGKMALQYPQSKGSAASSTLA